MTCASGVDVDLRSIARRGAAELGPDASAQEVLGWAARTFGHCMVVTSAMQNAVVIDLAARALPGVDVLFLDTGYHFAETIGTRDAVEHTYDVRLVNAEAPDSVAQQDRLLGRNLFASDPNQCCALRKVAPLHRELARYDAWVTGVRRADAPTRADTPLIGFDERSGLVKINPIAAWSDEQFDAYIRAHDVLVNPLVAEGYPSIGCAPCTMKPAPGSDPRSGRWAGTGKVECGMHA